MQVLENKSHEPSILALATHQYKHLQGIHTAQVAMQSDSGVAESHHNQTWPVLMDQTAKLMVRIHGKLSIFHKRKNEPLMQK